MTTTCFSKRQPLSLAQQTRLAKVFEHARKTAVAPKDFNYVVELFAQCILGDPGNVEYVRAYIEILQRKYGNNKKGCPLAALKERGARHAVKKALAEGHWDEVIRQGVKVLAVNPWDVPALTAMAAAAKGSGDLRCELAYLKAAVMGDPKNPVCNRLFAIAMTERGQIDQAIVFWHRVEEILRGDEEAQRAIRDLTMRKANSRGDFDGLDRIDKMNKIAGSTK